MIEERFIRDLNPEAILLNGWIDKTLEPSIALLNVDILVREMETDIYNHIQKNGKSDSSDKSLKRVNAILDLLEKVTVIVNQNNTYHLIAKHASIQIHNLQIDKYRLEKELEAHRKALNAD